MKAYKWKCIKVKVNLNYYFESLVLLTEACALAGQSKTLFIFLINSPLLCTADRWTVIELCDGALTWKTSVWLDWGWGCGSPPCWLWCWLCHWDQTSDGRPWNCPPLWLLSPDTSAQTNTDTFTTATNRHFLSLKINGHYAGDTFMLFWFFLESQWTVLVCKTAVKCYYC